MFFMAYTNQHTLLFLYVQEARWKSLYALLSFLLCFFVCVHFFDAFLFLFAQPFFTHTHALQKDFIMTDLTEAFSTMLLLSGYIACVCTAPLCIYFLLTFFTPSFFQKETTRHVLLCAVGFASFACSYALAYTTLLPSFWLFFLAFDTVHGHAHTPLMFAALQYEPRLAPYVAFTLHVLIWTHVICQLPCVAFIVQSWVQLPLHYIGFYRKYMHVALVFVSALVCPPDLMTQCVCWLVLSVGVEWMCLFLGLGHTYTKTLWRLTKLKSSPRKGHFGAASCISFFDAGEVKLSLRRKHFGVAS
jgi:sec-independent protein translocase protein TatC